MVEVMVSAVVIEDMEVTDTEVAMEEDTEAMEGDMEAMEGDMEAIGATVVIIIIITTTDNYFLTRNYKNDKDIKYIL